MRSVSDSFETIEASTCASILLSPSKTNCRRESTGIDQFGGKDDKTRRVRPPPGMKGTASGGSSPSRSDKGCWEIQVYVGSGNWVKIARGEDSHDGVPGGTSLYVGKLE